MKKVYILTEGGFGLGLGHVNRCLAIYQELRQRNVDIEIIVAATSPIPNVSNIHHQLLNWRDLQWLKEKISAQDIVIIDSYLASLEIYEYLSEVCAQLWVIDDNCRLRFPKNARIINPSLNAKSMDYLENQLTTGLLGTNYAILRPDFLGEDISYAVNQRKNQWLVTFGGMDVLNLTPKLIKEICAKYTQKTFKIIVAPDYHNLEEIRATVRQIKNVELLSYLSAHEMRRVMQESEGVICACGQTIYELLYVGVPFIPIQVVDNQINNAKGLRQIGVPVCASFEELKTQFEGMQNSGYKVANRVVDGKGINRIVNEIIGE